MRPNRAGARLAGAHPPRRGHPARPRGASQGGLPLSRRRRIAVFTGNRAEYSHQYPILKAVSEDPRLEYFLIVSGAHLKEDFGRTVEEIRADGFEVHAEARIDMPADDLLATAEAIGSGVQSVSRILAAARPDAFVVYADRFEGFAALVAGTQMAIPTAHVEGGDYTEGGALDDSVRHAMTKLAHLHFVTNPDAARRVALMGEEPWRIHTVGLPVLDLIKAGRLARPEEVYAKLGLDATRPILVFTQHSVATEHDEAAAQVRPSLEALVEAGKRWGAQTIVTYPNDDAGGRRIISEIERVVAEGHPFLQARRSLGRRLYHGVLNVATAYVGNSSSGIKETPAFGIPAVNVGPRQQGRLRGGNVLDVPYDRGAILEAIRRSIEDQRFRDGIRAMANPYGAGDAGPRIAEVLATISLDRRLVQKRMTY